MRLPGYFTLRTISPGILGQLCLLALQACGSTESFTQVDVLGSYLYVDELNMAAGSSNQVHVACRRSNGRPIAAVDVQVEASKAGEAPSMLTDHWLVADGQGKQHLSFSLPEDGMYTLALKLKLPGSDKVFKPEQAYTIVQVLLDGQAAGMANQLDEPQVQAGKPIQMIAPGIALNTQVLLLDDQQQLQLQARTVRFQSTDRYAILPDPISITVREGGNKIVQKGTKLYTFGEQTILAIEDETSRIVSEQRYLVTFGTKTVYRALLQKPLDPVVADGQTLAQVHLTLTDGNGEPIKQVEVALAIGQGSAIRSLSARTDSAGMATFSWSETVAGNKPMELFLKVPSGMLPIQQDAILFVPGEPARLQFITAPAIVVAGELLQPVPVVQVVDAVGNMVPMQDVPVTLTLAGGGSLGMSTLHFAGETTTLLQEGIATFPDVAILLAGSNMQLTASAPGLVPASSTSFTVSPAEMARLAFSLQPATGLAYGVSNAVSVAVQDAFGNLVPENGIAISLSLTGASNGYQLIGSVLATTREGMANLDAALNRSGSGFIVVASAQDLLPATSQTFDVATGAPDSLLSQITLTSSGPVIADGEEQHTVEVVLRDGQNTPIVGFPVGISSPLGQIQVAYPLGITTDNNGAIRIELRSTLAGEKTILVEMGPINRQLSPMPIFLAGAPAQANLSLNQSTLKINGIDVLTVSGRLEDNYGNLLPNMPYMLSSNVPTDTILPSSGITDNQGRLSASWRGTLASTLPRGLSLESGSYLSLPVQAIFSPGDTSATYSNLAAMPSTAIADGQSIMLLQARIVDSYNNPIPGLQLLFTVSGEENLLPDAVVYTNELGIAQTSLRSFASQDKVVGVKLGGAVLQTVTVTFLPSPCIGRPVLSFESKQIQTLQTGNGPSEMITGDFNKDKIVDLAVANTISNRLGIFMGRADGTFAAQVSYSTGILPRAIKALDVNRDGILDLALINETSNYVSIFIGRSGGTFATQVTYPTENYPRDLTTLDANRDGITDLAVANSGSDTLSIFMGQADGTFAPQIVYAAGSYPRALTTIDANRDGIDDLAVTIANTSTLVIFRGQADGTFVAQGSYGTGGWPRGISTLDANRDGIMDLAVINFNSESIGIFMGRADGTFESQVTYRTGSQPTVPIPIDVNRDGIMDLAVTSFVSNTLSVFIGRSDGTFAPQMLYGTLSAPIALAALDANQDGIQDLAVSSSWSNAIGIFSGRADGTFGDQTIYAIAGSYPKALTLLDANRDEMMDLAVVNYFSNTLGIFMGRADGTFAAQVSYWTGSNPNALITLDANRDGIVDLAVANSGSDNLGIFMGRADGTFAGQVTYATGSGPTALTTLDANRDGIVDLAVANSGSNNFGIFSGQANGTFTAQANYGTGSNPVALTTLDANRDGIMDLAVVNNLSNTLGIFMGRADGTFVAQVTYGAGSASRDLVTLDANRDGIVDLAVVNYNSNTLSIFIGRTNGTFVGQVTYGTGIRPHALTVLDINLDGIQDIFVAGARSSLHLGLPNGTFSPAYIYNRTGLSPVVGDFNKDYVPDFVMLSGDIVEFVERQYCLP